MRKFFSTIIILVFVVLLFSLVTNFYQRLSARQAPPLPPPPEKTISLREGWTNLDIARYLATEVDLWPVEEFLAVVGSVQAGYSGSLAPDLSDFKVRFPWLPQEAETLEGYLFPDTYRVFASTTPVEVANRALENFQRKVNEEIRADILASGRSLQETMALAALVEKEAPINYLAGDDRQARLVAGVFANRLGIGQALQADATLSYIFNDNKPQHSGEELTVDSPYNTYKYPGLPPGPIANPGLLAIKAAINPAQTSYFYFLTPTGTRDVIYARTYQEHLQNKYKYLK